MLLTGCHDTPLVTSCFHFNSPVLLAGCNTMPLVTSWFTACAANLRERFSLSGIFYLALLPDFWELPRDRFWLDIYSAHVLISITFVVSECLDKALATKNKILRFSRPVLPSTYCSSYNLIPAISWPLIGRYLIFCSPTWPTYCNSPRKCTPVKYKAWKTVGFPFAPTSIKQEAQVQM